MPTYEYACKSCGDRLEVQQKFTDDALTECPACGGALRKVFGNVGISFKGSGFYKTDSRKTTSTSSSSASGETKGEGKSEGAKDSPSPSSGDSSPAAPSTPKSGDSSSSSTSTAAAS
jgi:putative FmdB family regulatory protein